MYRNLFSRLMPWWAALLVVALLAPSGPAGHTDLHFTEPAMDVGEVRCGAPLSHRFAFVNQGSAPIEIVDVRAGCGCLIPRLSRRTYQPGEAGSLLLEINTLSQPEGPHTWTCQVTCQAAGRRFEVPLQITGRVIAEVTVRPAVVTVFLDQGVAHELVLTDRRPQPLAITELRTTSSRLNARLAELEKDGQGHALRRIRLEITADYPEGRHDEVLHLVTDDPLYRELKIPVTVVKRDRPRVTAAPAEVTFQAGAGQNSLSRLVRLSDRQNQNVVVERVASNDPALTCQWAPGPDAQSTLKVRVDRSRLSGARLDCTIHVHISHPVRETLTIPVKLELRD